MTAEWRVALVGAGPGNPGLLTLRGAECLSMADVVLYDRLVPTRLLDHVPAQARRVCVDELPGCHPERWPHIHQVMIEAARHGLRVVRLKGGDPFIFGRGGEEAEALRQAGIPFEIVPGVTAASAAGAFAGIPLTHRLHASAVALVTGHQRPGADTAGLDWNALARFPGTLAFYMGIARLAEIVQSLIGHGKSPGTPAAAVAWASTGRQRTVEAPLAELPEAVQRAEMKAPALIFVGTVVGLRSELNWFERLPLFGKRVLVTRPAGQSGDFVQRLEALGASPIVIPAVEIGEPPDPDAVDRAIAALTEYHWLVFTSVNGVHAFLRQLRKSRKDPRALGGVRIAAIGPATAEALSQYYLEADLVPTAYRSEELAAALKSAAAGQRVLLVRADRGRELLREELSKVAVVDQVPFYSQRDARPDVAALQQLRQGVDYITLTSANIARAVVGWLAPEQLDAVRAGDIKLVTISPVTTAAVHALDLPVAAEASEYTTDGLLRAVCDHAGSN